MVIVAEAHGQGAVVELQQLDGRLVMGARVGRLLHDPPAPPVQAEGPGQGARRSFGHACLPSLDGRLFQQAFALFGGLVYSAHHVEGLLRQVVPLALQNLLEAAHRLANGHVAARAPGEGLGHEHGLRQEALDLARPHHRQLVFLGKLLHAQDGDDVLQVLVALQHPLHLPRHLVVLVADDAGVEDAREAGQRVHRRVKPLLGDGALQGDDGVQVAEGGDDARVGVVVGGHVDGLEGGDGAPLGGGDALLQLAHVGGQGGLVAHRRGHPPQQGRDLHVGQDVAVDVVNEQEHVLPLHVAEVFGHGDAGEAHPRPHARRLVHLAEDEHRLVNDPRGAHLVPEVVALAGALAHAGEDGEAAVLGGDVADQLHDDDRLAHAGAAVGTHLTALAEGADEVNDLQPRLQHLGAGGALLQGRGRTVDGPALLGLHLAQVVQGLTQHVEEAPQAGPAHRHGDGLAGVHGPGAPAHAVGAAHGQAAHPVVAHVLLHLGHQPLAVAHVYLHGVVDGGQLVGRELDVHHRADDLDHPSFRPFGHRLLPPVPALLLGGGGLEGLHPGRDLQKLLGDDLLAHLVQEQRQVADEAVGVVGGVAHGHHAGRLLAGHRLQHRLVDLALHIAGQQLRQHRLPLGLVDVVVAPGDGLGRRLHRQQLEDLGPLHGGADESGVEQVDLVGRPRDVVVHGDAGDGQDVIVGGAVAEANEVGHHLLPRAQEEVAPLPSHGHDAHGLARLQHELGSAAVQVGRQAAAQPPVGGDEHQLHRPHLGPAPQQRVELLRLQQGHRLGQVGQHPAHALGVGAGGQGRRLGPPHLGGGHQLHRPGHLGDVLDAADAPSDLAQAGHGRPLVGHRLLELADGLPQLLFQLRRQVLALLDGLHDVRVLGLQEAMEGDLEVAHLGHRHVVQEAVDAAVDDGDLLPELLGLELGLLQHLGEALAPLQLAAGGHVQLAGAELGEGSQLAILGQGEAQAPRHPAHGPRLGGAAHPRHRQAGVDGWPDTGVEQVRLQVDLAVGDGDDVGGDVGRDVAGLGLDDGQGRQGAAAELRRQLGRPLQEARVQIEHVARVGLAPGGTPQQERHLPVGPGVLGQVVVDDEGVLPLLHELLAHGAAGVGGQILQGGRVGGVGRHHDGVLHGPVFLQGGHHLGHLGGLLADGHVDAEEVAAPLGDDGVQADGRLAGEAVADDQLSLAAADGDHGVNGLDTRVHRRVDALAHHHVGGDALHRPGALVANGALAVQGAPQGVHHPAQQPLAHRHLDDAAGGAHLVALLDVQVVAQDDGAHRVLLQVEGQPQGAALELQHLVIHAVAQAVDAGDAVARLHHHPHVGGGDAGRELLDLLADDGGDLVGPDSHLYPSSLLPPRRGPPAVAA